MNRWAALRRFAPLAAVVAVQLVIVASVPSRQPTTVEAAAGGGLELGDGSPSPGNPFGGLEVDGGDGTGGGDGSDGSQVFGGGSEGTGIPGDSTGTGGDPGDTSVTTVPRPSTGDTSHCVGDRQADPTVYAWVPPCVAKFTGDNGGATAERGVTADKIKVVIYRGNYGEAVDAILTAQGGNPSLAQLQAMADAAFGWMNQNYEFYGRQVEVKVVQGECASVPPDYACMRNEVRGIVQREKPFVMMWSTSVASPFFDELSALKVINLGGYSFRDQFSLLRRPYHYDTLMGGTQLADMVADWYCRRLYGGGTAKARYAGDADIASRVRVLGVISTDDPENKNTISELAGFLNAKCGAKIEHTYFYAQDITTAEQQRDALIREMRSDPEATTIMCFCDQVAPAFLYGEAQDNGYFPEHLIVGTGFMDTDGSGQSYGSLEVRQDSRGSQFDNAFGLAMMYDEEAVSKNHATRLMQAMGSNTVPYGSANRDVDYYAMIGALIQGAGPNLTPASVEVGAASGGLDASPTAFANPRFNPRSVHPERAVAGNNRDYTWFDAVREVYWSTITTSEVNGEQGAFLPVGDGRWYTAGQFPNQLLELPAKPR